MFLGFDTSNYTTSAALFDGEKIYQQKKLLCVKSGERGLRQSDAVFQHTVQMPDLLTQLPHVQHVNAVAVSTRPRNAEGSYMPCFLVGRNTAAAVSKAADCPLFETSHQVGHLLAALYSAGRMDLLREKFIAFHVSGGTTEALLVAPHAEEILRAQTVAQSTDLKAGQLVDRTGVLLGLDFPCGRELEQLALQSDRRYKIRPSMQGADCSLSGVENKVKKMLADGEEQQNIARFVLDYISMTLACMTDSLLEQYGNLPLLFAGGVMSDSIIRNVITGKYDAYFAAPEFSCDNAAGIALFAALKAGYQL